MYDSFGLRYSVAHLDKVRFDIAFWPVSKQALYVNRVTYDNVGSKGWLYDKVMMEPVNADHVFKSMNTTSVGNLAFIVLNAPVESMRERAKLILSNYKDYIIRNSLKS